MIAHPLFTILGVILIVVTAIDLAKTTFGLSGAGPISSRLSEAAWRALLFLHHRRSAHRMLAAAGPVIVLATVLLWVFMLWVGVTLIFCGSETAILHGEDRMPADFWSRAYYAGFTLITLGVGDYTPNGPVWQVATVCSSAAGFFFITLTITYLLPLVSAIVRKRSFAAQLTAVGASPREFLESAWNGHDFSRLESFLNDLSPMTTRLGQDHLAYPSMTYFHTENRELAVAPSLAVLDETLTILQVAVVAAQRPDPLVLQSARRSITMFLKILESDFVSRPEHPPPCPALEQVLPAEVKRVSNDDFTRKLAEFDDRRCLLLGFVSEDGWSWRDVAEGSSTMA